MVKNRRSLSLSQNPTNVKDVWREAERLFEVDDYAGAWTLVRDLEPLSSSELLIVGIAASSQDADQERARNLLTRALDEFTQVGNSEQADRTKVQLALSYWRSAEMQEALVYSEAAFAGALTGKLKAWSSLDRAVILTCAGHTKLALELLNEMEPLAATFLGLTLRGKFYGQRAVARKKLGSIDLALADYARAEEMFRESGNEILQAAVLSNRGSIHLERGEFSNAHACVDQAIVIFSEFNDRRLAKSLDQRAAIFIAQKRYRGALIAAQAAVAAIGDLQPDWMAEALITLGIVLARTEHHEQARENLQKAASICERLGDNDRAGIAYATLLEEIPLNYRDALRTFLKADEICSDRKRVLSLGVKVSKLIEPSFIKLALEEAGGKITKAAHSLGMGHSLLINRIKRYKLDTSRTTPRIRRWKRRPVLSLHK